MTANEFDAFDSREQLAAMVAVDPPPAIRSVASDLLDQSLSAPRRHVTTESVWVPNPERFEGGSWVVIDQRVEVEG
jgi:hypothetical protein